MGSETHDIGKLGSTRTIPSLVMRGLDPRIHAEGRSLLDGAAARTCTPH